MKNLYAVQYEGEGTFDMMPVITFDREEAMREAKTLWKHSTQAERERNPITVVTYRVPDETETVEEASDWLTENVAWDGWDVIRLPYEAQLKGEALYMTARFGFFPDRDAYCIGNGETTLEGWLFGNDECWDGDDFFQYFVTKDGKLYRAYFDTTDEDGEEIADLGDVDYDDPWKFEDMTGKIAGI